MAKAAYWQRGETLDYPNTAVGATKIDANTIIEIGSLIGVAGADIAVGETGAVHVAGVYEMPKTSSNAITLGTKVYFDGTGITEDEDDGATPPVPYTPAGYAAVDAGASADKILVKLLG
jgi:Uncharacterized conserved protein